MAVLNYLTKFERGLGLTSGAYFLYDFPIKMFLIYNTLSMDKVSTSHLFYFSRYQTKRVIKLLFRQLVMS